jgi:hypothetical protein
MLRCPSQPTIAALTLVDGVSDVRLPASTSALPKAPQESTKELKFAKSAIVLAALPPTAFPGAKVPEFP